MIDIDETELSTYVKELKRVIDRCNTLDKELKISAFSAILGIQLAELFSVDDSAAEIVLSNVTIIIETNIARELARLKHGSPSNALH